MSEGAGEQLVTATEAARAVGRKVNTVRTWLDVGLVPTVERRGSVRLVRLTDVERVAARMAGRAGNEKMRGCGRNRGETMADLERLIAERMAHLPGWWWGQRERERGCGERTGGDEAPIETRLRLSRRYTFRGV